MKKSITTLALVLGMGVAYNGVALADGAPVNAGGSKIEGGSTVTNDAYIYDSTNRAFHESEALQGSIKLKNTNIKDGSTVYNDAYIEGSSNTAEYHSTGTQGSIRMENTEVKSSTVNNYADIDWSNNTAEDYSEAHQGSVVTE